MQIGKGRLDMIEIFEIILMTLLSMMVDCLGIGIK
jgi:hypothetical protein